MTENIASGEPELWEGKNKFVGNNGHSLMEEAEVSDDTRADLRVVLVVFVCTVFMAVHFISGWTFDF